MARLRAAFEALGFADVASFGASGNLLFTDPSRDRAALERRIAARLGTPAFVRTAPQLRRILAHPEARRPGANVMLLARTPTPDRRAALEAKGPCKVRGAAVHFVPGVRPAVDVEKALGVAGTSRTARVLAKVAGLLSKPPT